MRANSNYEGWSVDEDLVSFHGSNLIAFDKIPESLCTNSASILLISEAREDNFITVHQSKAAHFNNSWLMKKNIKDRSCTIVEYRFRHRERSVVSITTAIKTVTL